MKGSCVFVVVLLTVGQLRASEPTFEAVAPLLTKYCISCHSGAKPKGDLNLAELSPNFAKNAAAWKSVFERLKDDSMPPKSKPRPSAPELTTIQSWLTAGLTAHEAAKAKSDGRTRHRRLNRIEYASTIRDLLGAVVDIETLPEDGALPGLELL